MSLSYAIRVYLNDSRKDRNNENTIRHKTGRRNDESEAEMICDICQNWARNDVLPYVPANKRSKYKVNGISLPLVPNHHPGCEHYEDSLIDVWKVSYDGQHYYTDKAPTSEETESGETVEQTKMHKEVFEQLPEFEGF